jgi:hypothetical protein
MSAGRSALHIGQEAAPLAELLAWDQFSMQALQKLQPQECVTGEERVLKQMLHCAHSSSSAAAMLPVPVGGDLRCSLNQRLEWKEMEWRALQLGGSEVAARQAGQCGSMEESCVSRPLKNLQPLWGVVPLTYKIVTASAFLCPPSAAARTPYGVKK